MADLLIRNATLVDGTGAAPRMADVRTAGDRIAEIADAGTLDAGGAETLGGIRALFVVEDIVRQVGTDLQHQRPERRGERRTDTKAAFDVGDGGAHEHAAFRTLIRNAVRWLK